MQEEFDALTLLAMAELNQLRTQALDLFDRCLTEGNPAPVVSFIERQVTDDPPHLQLLREFTEDLQQRLLSLRGNHFDIRERIVRMFIEAYGVDIAVLVPLSELAQYHLIDPQRILEYARQRAASITDKDLILLGKLLDVSIKTAERLQRDIKLTTELQAMVMDWLDALSSTVGRQYWSDNTPSKPLIQ